MAKREQSPVAGHCSKVYLLWQTLIRHCVSLSASNIIDKNDGISDFRVYLKFFCLLAHRNKQFNEFDIYFFLFLFFLYILWMSHLYIRASTLPRS